MGKKSDLSRQERKAKKRAVEEQIPDVPRGLEADVVTEEDHVDKSEKVKKRKRESADDTTVAGEEAHEKKRKKAKKDAKKDSVEEKSASEPAVSALHGEAKAKVDLEAFEDLENQDRDSSAVEPAPKKRKKERKAELRAAQLAAAQAVDQVDGDIVQDSATDQSKNTKPKNNRNREKKRKAAAAQSAKALEGKPPRFIVFVGNLPFTATTASITAHFAKLKPVSVRNLTQKNDPNKSRGMAFVEFENYDTHKTALKVMHHSSFDDGLSEPRKINVELTVGGGGNKDGRQAKIKTKNERLDEQRFRRIQGEAKAKSEKAVSNEKTNGIGSRELEKSAIHPSRQKLVSI